MKIGCPKEIKPQEFRVGMTPNAAQEAVAHGHEVVIETNAGHGAGKPTYKIIEEQADRLAFTFYNLNAPVEYLDNCVDSCRLRIYVFEKEINFVRILFRVINYFC